MGVTDVNSTEHQVRLALGRLEELAAQRIFLFLNVSALHQPNNIYLDPAVPDSPESQAAALAYVDAQLGPLFDFMRKRGPVIGVICSDHGTAYGEGGYHGHRLSHPVVLDVPYGEFYSDGEGVES